MEKSVKKKLRLKRNIYKKIYPALMKAGKLFGLRAGTGKNKDKVFPPASFYSLKTTANNGETINFETFRGKKVLIVNTATYCGYTPQFSELKWLYEWYKGRLIILGFPANDFKEQEKGTDEEIKTFCINTYGIRFPLMKKSQVVKGENQNEVFEWLTNKEMNGWNDKAPVWNFTKYLVNEKGVLTHYFETGISPVSKQVLRALSLTSQ
jgi:glutathione peroxidase